MSRSAGTLAGSRRARCAARQQRGPLPDAQSAPAASNYKGGRAQRFVSRQEWSSIRNGQLSVVPYPMRKVHLQQARRLGGWGLGRWEGATVPSKARVGGAPGMGCSVLRQRGPLPDAQSTAAASNCSGGEGSKVQRHDLALAFDTALSCLLHQLRSGSLCLPS